MRNSHTDSSRKARTRWGIALSVTGAVFLIILLISFWMTDGDARKVLNPVKDLTDGIFHVSKTSSEVSDEVRGRPRIEVPHTTGSSELKEYYKNNPRDKAMPHEKAEEEDDFYTRPDGSAWVKDKSNEDILGDTKKGEGNKVTEQKPAAGKAEAVTNRPLHVEFWESPVNFKGYKMNGNNLILYGISPDDSLRFERRQDGVWMYHFNENAVYLLEPTSEDKPFKRINN